MTVTSQLSLEQVTAALRRWTGKDEHQRGAEELLIEHGFWLSRADFLEAALNYDVEADAARIWWSQAREFLHSGPPASTTELAVLDFATALGGGPLPAHRDGPRPPHHDPYRGRHRHGPALRACS